MREKTIILKDASRVNWSTVNRTTDGTEPHSYPGDMNIQLGCLMRIADSVEKMEKPYTMLQDRIKVLENEKKSLQSDNEALQKVARSLKTRVYQLKKDVSMLRDGVK